jgi:hypothetical protein
MLPAAWRSRWWLWAVPLALALANAAFLIIHPGRTGAGYATMEQELEREQRALHSVTEKERAVATVLGEARSSREALIELYRKGFSTEAERLTRLITEVKRLSQRSGLVPKSISYPEETLEEYGLVRMSLLFGVQGTYPQLRMLVNLLERSDLFLVLERVGLGGSRESTLSISLEISTFFASDPDALEAGALETAPPAEAARQSAASPARPTGTRAESAGARRSSES